uniref:Uncharacterized protein n=2 Tax=Nicotiana TaxID=4085 RepID=A0A1S4BNM8_TOBAC|nr:PREDICTED: uncharacterized protein LOC104224462 [Nicotiana sylvestris]XP_016490473.1 PREDICTED: uncharacterized protein LOC107810229 [Nicotiana tabacum]
MVVCNTNSLRVLVWKLLFRRGVWLSGEFSGEIRKLLGYITGEKKAPAVTDPNNSQWDSDNSLVMTCTAKKIWNLARPSYSRKGNDAQIFEIRNKIPVTTQGELTVTDYCSKLSGLRQEIDYYQDLQAKCSNDAVLFQQLIEKERVYDFLAGLNQKYDQIRVQVLGKVPFPSLEDAYSYVQQEESRRGVMLYSAPTENPG